MSKLLGPKRLAVAAVVTGVLLLGVNLLLQAQEHRGEMMMMQTAESKKLEKHVNAVKAKAGKEGYACCIRPSCEWCAVHMGHCTCHHGVETGMGPCRECHGGWEAGEGHVTGKTREDVRNQPIMKM
jgi:hypothetical protein